MKNNIFIFFILLVITGSCENLSNKDHSLIPEEYEKLGMPDYSRAWTFEDYKNACKVLDDIKNAKPLSLPVKNSDRSGMYFNRIINLDNLDFLLDETLTFKQKAYKIQAYIDIHSFLVRLYTDLNNTEQYYNQELIDLYIFGLTITQNMLDLGYQINESIDENDIEMQSGFRSIQFMYITMVLFVLESQEKVSSFKTTDLERLSDFVSSSVLLNKDWMESAAAEDVKLQLQKVKENTSSEHVIEKYNKLIESM
jgi:hypothetical protein